MARAFCGRVQEQDAFDGNISVALDCLFYGPEIAGEVRFPVNFTVEGADTLATMGAKATTAIVTRAERDGITVARTACVFPALTQGS